MFKVTGKPSESRRTKDITHADVVLILFANKLTTPNEQHVSNEVVSNLATSNLAASNQITWRCHGKVGGKL